MPGMKGTWQPSQPLTLTDSANVELTVDSDSNTFYNISSAGSDTNYAYLSAFGDQELHIEQVKCISSADVTLTVDLEISVNGGWKLIPAYQITDTVIEAQGFDIRDCNTLYPNHSFFPKGQKIRFKIVNGTASASTISLQVVGW